LTTNQQVGCSSHPGRASYFPLLHQENQRVARSSWPKALSVCLSGFKSFSALNSTLTRYVVVTRFQPVFGRGRLRRSTWHGPWRGRGRPSGLQLLRDQSPPVPERQNHIRFELRHDQPKRKEVKLRYQLESEAELQPARDATHVDPLGRKRDLGQSPKVIA